MIYISELTCLKCGAVMPIPRTKSNRRKKGHIKDLWCYVCKEVTKHQEG